MQHEKPGSAQNDGSARSDEEKMSRFGITRIPTDYFHYKTFRYTNLNDAVAQAKRDGLGD